MDQLREACGLAGAVYPDNQHDLRPADRSRPLVISAEKLLDLLLHDGEDVFAGKGRFFLCLSADRLEDRLRHRNAEVGAQQGPLQRVQIDFRSQELGPDLVTGFAEA